MSKTEWPETRQKFRHIVAREGARAVAKRIPVHHATVYRLLSGEHANPCRAVEANIERMVRADEEKGEGYGRL